MEVSIKVNGKIQWQMEEALSSMQKDLHTKEIGKTICNMGLGVRHGVRERLNLKAITSKVKRMVKESMSGLMAAIMKVNSSTVSSKVKVSQFSKIVFYFFLFLLIFSILGMYYFAESERTYKGQFMNNLFDGKGKLTFADGRIYEGDFRGGKREG